MVDFTRMLEAYFEKAFWDSIYGDIDDNIVLVSTPPSKNGYYADMMKELEK